VSVSKAESPPAPAQSPELIWFGAGPRRWQLLDAVAETSAIVLPAGAASQQWRLLQPDRADVIHVLAELDAARRSGLAVAAIVTYEAGLCLQPPAAHVWPVQGRPQPAVPVLAAVAFDPAVLVQRVLPAPTSVADPDTQYAESTEPLGRQQQAFEAAVVDVLERIAAGEVYQVNLTADAFWPAAVVPAPLQLAAAVLAAQPVPFGLCWHDKDFTVVSGSMERFVSVHDGQIAARPIKGTAPRWADTVQDLASRDALLASHKERAENLMIVDMMRNDLQRVCVRGTVAVQELLAAVPYKTLWHLESEIVGQLQDPMDLLQLLCQTLPPASVTGCPKVQALQVIAQHEPSWRGPYCGVLGVALPDGRQDWSVAIRTLVFANGQTRLQVGAGLVADSQPALEWQELLHKATAGERALQLAQQGPSAGRS